MRTSMLCVSALSTAIAFVPRMTRAPWRTSTRSSVGRAAAAKESYDVAVIGGGPAGYAMAALLADAHGRSVVLVDPNPDAPWPNNYGEWKEEWACLAERLAMPELMSAVRREWPVTDCFFGGSYERPWDERTRLQRAYLQVFCLIR